MSVRCGPVELEHVAEPGGSGWRLARVCPGGDHVVMRLFVALAPPSAVVDEMQVATRPLSVSCPAVVRWTRPEQWHLTVAFLGEVDDPSRAALVDQLGWLAAQAAPFTLSVASAGRFDHRVLWARVRGELAALERLAASVRAVAGGVGLPTEDRPYRPHLTLARADGDVDLSAMVTALAGFESSPWLVDALCLVRSRWGVDPRGSPLYETMATWPMCSGR